MVISEKQIMQLVYIATEYRRELLSFKEKRLLSETGQVSLNDTSAILQQINDQQSEELKIVE